VRHRLVKGSQRNFALPGYCDDEHASQKPGHRAVGNWCTPT